MSFTYDDQPASNVGDAVRFLIGDTDEDGASKHVSDGEMLFVLQRFGFSDHGESYDATTDQMKLLQMAAESGRALVAKYASEAHYAMGGMSESANQKGAEVRKRVRELERLVARGARPRFLGQSEATKAADLDRSNLVQSAFRRGMFANASVDVS